MNARAESTYNGWTNYATWRVMLEVFDGMGPEDIANAEHAREFVDMAIEHAMDPRNGGVGTVVDGWLQAWLSDVNWDEIAEAVRGED